MGTRSSNTNKPQNNRSDGHLLEYFRNTFVRGGGGTNNFRFYAVSPSTSSVNEGSSVTFTVTTTNVPNGTTLYWSTNTVSGTVNASDFSDSATSGSFTITSGSGTVVRTLSNDATTEGSESFQLQIRTDSTSGEIVTTSSTVTIGDTSLNPTYSVSPSTSSVNEGSAVTFTVTTTDVPNGTTLYWSTNTVSGTVNASDFSDAATSGSFTITSGSGTVVRTLANDTTTEGSESFQLQIRTGSTSGTIVATSSTVTINDTSLTPFNASGGSISDSGGVRRHTFTGPGTFSVTSGSKTVTYLVVAGGGGGGGNRGAGGGGGGTRTGNVSLSNPTSYPVSIGGGGGNETNGQPSAWGPITSTYGGRGGGNWSSGANGGPGGSGGGGGHNNGTGGTGNIGGFTPAEGTSGGSGTGDPNVSGGGGGATESGGTAGGPGRGGAGLTFNGVGYGGGGGGGMQSGNAAGSPDGSGAASNNDAAANRGGGGGGGGNLASGRSGGSGIVIVTYPYP